MGNAMSGITMEMVPARARIHFKHPGLLADMDLFTQYKLGDLFSANTNHLLEYFQASFTNRSFHYLDSTSEVIIPKKDLIFINDVVLVKTRIV